MKARKTRHDELGRPTMTDPELLQAGFDQRAPWITRFEIDGREYGGAYDAGGDDRLRCFFQRFPRARRVLELGCLEGGHTFPLAAAAREVVAIDVQAGNLEKCRWLTAVLGTRNIRWVEADLETDALDSLGRFDVIYCSGLLYHLQEPWSLLRRAAPLTRAIFVWTHTAPPDRPLCERGGYLGVEIGEPRYDHPLKGMRPTSFWPSQPELVRMLRDCGFTRIDILDDSLGTDAGPGVLLAAYTPGRMARLAAGVGRRWLHR